MADAVLAGGGAHARVLEHVLVSLGHRVLGFSAPAAAGARVAAPYLGPDAELGIRVRPADVIAILALGATTVDARRMLVWAALTEAGFRFPPIVAPSATVHADVHLGDACVVLEGAVVVTGTRLGVACIVNTHATVDHDCDVGDDVHIAPGATVCGGVRIGPNCVIGAGATLVNGVRVAPGTLVGAGATVVGHLDSPGTYVGTPARRIR